MSEPTPATELLQKRKLTALSAILGLSLLLGITSAAAVQSKSPGLQLIVVFFQLAPLLAGFVWLHHDSIEHGFVRSLSLNIGIVMLAIVFVPVYFFRTRPPGARAPVIRGFLGLIAASITLSMLGAFVMLTLAGGNVPAAGL